MIDISIIILNWNGNDDTVECLQSIKHHLDSYLSIQVILVDNASRVPLSNEQVNSHKLNNISYIKNDENYGFAEGNNIGLREAVKHSPKYIILLNNDTVITDDSIIRMFKFMEQNENFAVCGAVNYYHSNPGEVWQAGILNNFRNGNQTLVSEFDRQSGKPVEVDYVPGSSIMARTSVLNVVGFLDSRYFAYYEENDLCVRIKRAGHKIGFLPDTKILHKVGKSSDSVTKFYLRARNKLLFYNKFSAAFWFDYIVVKEFMKNFLKAFVFYIKYHKISYFRALYLAYYDYFHAFFDKGSLGKI
jgi:GT2 family glycosyltransferase